MNQPRDWCDYLENICKAARKALDFTEGVGYEEFLADDKTVYAVVRALEIVGEATKRIPQDVHNSYPDIPWRSMAGIRDKLIHDYVNVSLEVVWRTLNEDLPPLLPMIERVIDETAP
jgi:uncharacterized protein with HEPN domain